jgi:hypothetical protein
MADALVAEGRRRAATGSFYGFMNYVSIIASKT